MTHVSSTNSRRHNGMGWDGMRPTCTKPQSHEPGHMGRTPYQGPPMLPALATTYNHATRNLVGLAGPRLPAGRC